MGRPKAYARDAVVEQALAAFWQTGWEATSLQRLEAVTGLNKFSLYAEFGSKRGLYLACMEAYVSANLIPAFHQCPTPLAPADFLRLVARNLGAHPGMGCFLLLGALELEGKDADLNHWVAATYGALEARLAAFWDDAPRAAGYITVVQGLMTAGRLGTSQEQLLRSVEALVPLFS